MNRVKIFLVLAILALAAIVGWQVAACELANIELRDDMKDLASQLAGRIGFTPPSSDEDFRQAVIKHALKYGIQLGPKQVTVVRTGTGVAAEIYLAADYTAAIHLPGFNFNLHFTPSAGKKP
jgi:ABC-type sugar transport system substrate-binding protein